MMFDFEPYQIISNDMIEATLGHGMRVTAGAYFVFLYHDTNYGWDLVECDSQKDLVNVENMIKRINIIDRYLLIIANHPTSRSGYVLRKEDNRTRMEEVF